MSRSQRVTIVGQRSEVMRAVTALADSHGVDLVGSEPPRAAEDGSFLLEVTVKASDDDLTAAIDIVEANLPDGAAIARVG